MAILGKALAHKQLGALDVIRRQRSICCALFQLHCLLALAGNVATLLVVPTDATHVPNVVTQQRDDEVQPVARTDATFAQMLAPEHLLADQRHADRVAEIMIGRIAVGDELERHVTDIVDNAGIVGLQSGIGADIALAELIDERIDHDGGRIEHDPPSSYRPFPQTVYTLTLAQGLWSGLRVWLARTER